MDNNLKLEISQRLYALKAEYMKDGKFSEADLQKDLDDLNSLVNMQALGKLFELKPPSEMLKSEEEIAQYIDANFDKEELRSVIYSAADEVFSGWLASIGMAEN